MKHLLWHSTTVTATGYVVKDDKTRKCDTYPGKTSLGLQARPHLIATDTSVFPYGTRFKIPGYGDAIAADTGGAINGHTVDLSFSSCDAAFKWGRRNIKVEYARDHLSGIH